MARVDSDYRKAVAAVESLNVEKKRSSLDHAAALREGLPAVTRRGERDRVAVGPSRVKSAVSRDRSGESFHRAVVVARQSVMGTHRDWRRPGLATVGGARKQNNRFGKAKLGPADVEISRVLAIGVVGDDVRLVLEGNARLGRLGDDGVRFGLPRRSAIGRAAHENSVARG